MKLPENISPDISPELARDFDVIVVGGGHAGIEAAHSAARLGSKTLLITLDIEKIGLMPCNPAVGGVGKGHLVYEISAMGGLMPKLCTQTYLQVRMLNTSKGPAVQGLRLQIDKYAYNELSKKTLSQMPNLTLLSAEVEDVITQDLPTANLDSQLVNPEARIIVAGQESSEVHAEPKNKINKNVVGIKTADGTIYTAPCVVLTTGTFMNGKVHVGPENYAGGRRDEKAVMGLSRFLKNMGLKLGRLKTGTPPRLLRSSLDFSKMTHQEHDNLTHLFEFYPHATTNKRACYITHTNENTHQVIRDNLHLSAMYNGNISGIGPRYCPSIEDKIGRFAHKTAHQIFVEPEGANDEEIYPNGISTSLPYEVQKKYIATIPGFESAIITKPGYAIEYDFVLPDQLDQTLEVSSVPGLFLAGQINGTTGYEEAAAQGLMAGINAHQKAAGKAPFVLDRTESYIGVMINDLVRMSVDEPYRMFTSRAECRLSLRQDNAFLRLMPRAHELGMIEDQLFADFIKERDLIDSTLKVIRASKHPIKALEALDQPEHDTLSDRARLTIKAEISYEPYLIREAKERDKHKQQQELIIPAELDIVNMPGLSRELQEKLQRYAPKNIAQAALISGMTPAALSLLILKIKSYHKNNPSIRPPSLKLRNGHSAIVGQVKF
jgi:tRNA uridine 5-carboxymethylaminomethyl modification enzyme